MASSIKSGFVDRSKMSFGIETTVSYQGDGLHFWLDPRLIERGVGWLFPCGSQARFGVGSYIGDTNLGPKLESFLSDSRLIQSKDYYGNYVEVHLQERADPQDLLRSALQHAAVTHFEVTEPSLNDIFIEVVGGKRDA